MQIGDRMSDFFLNRMRLAALDPRRIEITPSPRERDAAAGRISLRLGRQYLTLDSFGRSDVRTQEIDSRISCFDRVG
jgi:hypothetical protein